MTKNIVLIGSLKAKNNCYSILNELLLSVVDDLAYRFNQVFLLNIDLDTNDPKVIRFNFDVTQENFYSFLSTQNINNIFTLAGGKAILSFIYQFFSDYPDQRKKVKFIGTNYRTLKILSNHSETQKFLTQNQVKFPSVQIIDQEHEFSLADTPLTFPTRLRLIKPKTHSLGLFYNIESLLEGIKNNLDENSTLQLEESALGDKEIEVIALRDKYQNVQILIHNEKIDPVGIHRDHSLVIYPTVTLLAREIDEIDRIVQRILKELGTPIVQIRFAISKDHQYRVLSIHSDLTTSEIIVSKIQHINLAKIIVELACGKTILELSRQYENLLIGDLDFFTVVAPYHEMANFSIKGLATISKKRANSLIIEMESNLVLGIRNVLLDLSSDHRQIIEENLTTMPDNYLVRQMMNMRIFRLHFIMEAIKRDFSLDDIREITKIDQGFLQILKFVMEVDKYPENSWQNPSYRNSNVFFPVQSKITKELPMDNQVVIRFDTRKIDHFSNVYRSYLRLIIQILQEKNQKIILLNNSFDNFDQKNLTLIQLPFEIIDFPATIDELSASLKNHFELGVVQNGSQIIYSKILQFNKNYQVQKIINSEKFINQINVDSSLIAASYNFSLDDEQKITKLEVTSSLSSAFYFSGQPLLKDAIELFIDAKLNL